MEDEGRYIVPPQYGRDYFSTCKVVPVMPADSDIVKDCSGWEGMEPAKLSGSYHLTPYAKYKAKCATPILPLELGV